MKDVSDELILAAKNGDSEASDELVVLLRESIYSAALIMLHNKEDAEDVTQEVFYRLFRSFHTLKNTDTFSAWLRTIVINTCRTYYVRNHQDNVDVEDDVINEFFSTNTGDYTEIVPHEKLEKTESDKIVYSLIGTLPEKFSQVLMLRYYGEMSYQAIAQELDINIGTVKSRINSAKEKLSSVISEYEKKHGITLHTSDIFGDFINIITNAGQYLNVPAGISTNAQTFLSAAASVNSAVSSATVVGNSLSSVTSIATSGVSTAVGTTISNTVATKISAAAAAVSIAACMGITAINFNTDSLPTEDNEQSFVSETMQESPQEEISDAEKPDYEPEVIVSTVTEMSIVEREVLREIYRAAEPSIIYRDGEVSVIHDISEVHDVSVVHDVSTVHEVSTVTEYVEKEKIVYVPVSNNDHNMDLSKSTLITSDDGFYRFRVYPNNNEATLVYMKEFSTPELVFPSYVKFNNIDVPVTRIERNILSSSDDKSEEKITTVVLPEKISELPKGFFSDKRLSKLDNISGVYNNITRIDENAFANPYWFDEEKDEVSDDGSLILHFVDVDLASVFPNLLEIESGAFGEFVIDKLTMPRNYTYCSEQAGLSANKVTIYCQYTDDGDNERYIPGSYEELNIILPGDKIGSLPKNVEYNTVLDLNLILENKDADMSGTRLANLVAYRNISNLNLPEGMKKIRSYEFDVSDYEEVMKGNICYDPEDKTFINSLYIPSTVTEIEDHAFDTQRNMIDKICLSIKGRTEEELDRLEEEIFRSDDVVKYRYCDDEYRYYYLNTEHNSIF